MLKVSNVLLTLDFSDVGVELNEKSYLDVGTVEKLDGLVADALEVTVLTLLIKS